MRIAGVLVGVDGAPVPAASVWLVAAARSPSDDDYRTVTTAADGTFAFEDVAVRSYTLLVRHDTYCAQRYVVSDVAQPVRLQLQPAMTIDIRVTHAGEPVADARVDLDGTSVHTDESGIARFQGIERDKPSDGFGDHDLFVTAKAFAQHYERRSFHGLPMQTSLTVTLERGARFSGVVRGPLGRLVPHAPIVVWSHPPKGEGPRFTKSRDDGTWSIELPPGRFRAHAALAPFEPLDRVVLTSDGTTARDDLVLTIGFGSAARAIGSVVRNVRRQLDDPTKRRIKGVVVDDTGAPCRAVVTVRRSQTFIERTVRTEDDGQFELDGLERNEPYLVSAEWARRASYRVMRSNVYPGEDSLRLVLSAGATVRGRVLLDGAPLTRFGIYLVPPNTSTRGGSIVPFDSVDGSFTLPHIAPGRWRVAIMGIDTKQHVVPERTFVHGDEVNLGDIVMERGTRITGVVCDEAGASVSGATVRIGIPAKVMWPGTDLERAFAGLYETTTDAEGRYVFAGITREEAMRPPLLWATAAARASLVRDLADDVELTVLPTGQVKGVIHGTPGGSVMIKLSRDGEPDFARIAHADEAQGFVFDDVPYGDYRALLDMPHGEPVAVHVDAGHVTRIELTVTATLVRVDLRVPEGRGRDVQFEPASPDARIDGRIRGSMTMNGEDSFSIYHVHPGRYRVTFDGATWTEVIVAPSPERQTFDLRSLR